MINIKRTVRALLAVIPILIACNILLAWRIVTDNDTAKFMGYIERLYCNLTDWVDGSE